MKYTVLSTLLCLCVSQAALAQTSTPAALAARGLAAGADYPGLADLCDLSKPLRIAGERPSDAESRPRPQRETARTAPEKMPTKVFDNLYFIGNRSVSSWALTTDDGVIVIDAMNSSEAAKNHIEEGLLALDIDPATIKYLIITHGHGDHYGGQSYLVKKYAPRVMMSDPDWRLIERGDAAKLSPRWEAAPSRDITVKDGDTLSLGNLKLNFYVTPGHTPGTLSLIFPVQDGKRTHYAGLWGGTGLNFGPDEARIREYSASATRFRALANAANVAIFLSNHASRDGSVERIEQLKARMPDAPHPFVNARASGAFELLADCSLAHAEQLHDRR